MDNQQGNLQHYFEVMAYSIGALTGDGSVKEYVQWSEERAKMIVVHNASISGMDLECLERVCKEIYCLFGKMFEPVPYKNPNGTQMYRVGFGSLLTYTFFNYFIGNKLSISDEVFRASKKAKRDFIAGLFDTDGWIAHSNGYYRLGYAARYRTLVEDVARLLMKSGVKVGKINESVSGYGTIMYRITPNLRSFIDKGFYFYILRKAERIKLYKRSTGFQSYSVVKPSETIMPNPQRRVKI